MMSVAVHIYQNGVDITPQLEYKVTSSHKCGYKVEEIIYQGQVIGTQESGMLAVLEPGYSAKILPA